MLRETLKQEIDQLDESQLRQIADFVVTIKNQSHKLIDDVPFWQWATPVERVEDLQSWIARLPETYLSLPDEEFDRNNIYE